VAASFFRHNAFRSVMWSHQMTDGVASRANRDGAPLYARILGEGWSQLAAPVRWAHATQSVVRAHGLFRIEHGGHPVARVLVRLLRVPPAGAAIDTRLMVTAQGDGERWERTFETARVETQQYAGHAAESELLERFGLLEFRFQLVAVQGSLRYRQREVAFRWRAVRVRIPARLAPRVEAREDPSGPRHVKAHVQVALPVIGPLMAYEGIIEIEEPRA
jgi:hypothetical protein